MRALSGILQRNQCTRRKDEWTSHKVETPPPPPPPPLDDDVGFVIESISYGSVEFL